MVDPPTVADATLDLIVRHVVPVAAPELVLLVGSRAYGTPRDDSDYDILLVLRDGSEVEPTRSETTRALRRAGLDVDVMADTIAGYERHQNDPGFIDYLAARQGVVLYATGAVPQRSPSRVHEDYSGEGVALWLRRAESDLRAAENSLSAADPSWDAICFHSHAYVEKLLKALIVQAGTFPPRTHELPELLTRLPADIRDDPVVAAACRLLMDLLPRSRYPKLPEPTPQEARHAIGAARDVQRLLRPRLPSKLSS